MKYEQFIKFFNLFDFTAFIYNSPNNGYQYSSGYVNDDVFNHTTDDTEFSIVGIDEVPEVKKVIIDNFLMEFCPAKNIVDENYLEIKRRLLAGEATVGYWVEYTKYGPDTIETTVYMLIL